MKYRQELKYLCTDAQLSMIGHRLAPLMQLDEHLHGREAYNIRSIYLDDAYDSFMHENEAGIDERMKMRIRIYDRCADVIKAEIKSKRNRMTHKRASRLDYDTCLRIMESGLTPLSMLGKDAAFNLMILRMHDKLLMPKTIVEYDRTVFVERSGNVRITFDRNIRCSPHIDRFFEEDAFAVPVLDPGMHVLEVKYDELIPDYLMQAMELGTLQQTAFSKYYLSRLKMEEYGYEY